MLFYLSILPSSVYKRALHIKVDLLHLKGATKVLIRYIGLMMKTGLRNIYFNFRSGSDHYL